MTIPPSQEVVRMQQRVWDKSKSRYLLAAGAVQFLLNLILVGASFAIVLAALGVPLPIPHRDYVPDIPAPDFVKSPLFAAAGIVVILGVHKLVKWFMDDCRKEYIEILGERPTTSGESK